MGWEFIEGDHIVCDLWALEDYVISCRRECFTVSYRPPDQHQYVGQYATIEEAKAAAEEHLKTLTV